MIYEQPFSQIYSLLRSDFYFNAETSYFIKIGDGCARLEQQEISTLGNKNILNLVDKDNKVLVHLDGDFFPFLFQDIPGILYFYSRIKYRNFKIYIYTMKEDSVNYPSLKNFLIKYLTDINVKFEFLSKKDFDGISINNFVNIFSGFDPFSARLLNSKTRKYLKTYSPTPFKKVFVARNKNLAQRIDSDERVKSFFVESGFEIIYPEQFESFIDQINYFSDCKVIAGISGSGLSNCIFMKPGGIMIELSSPLKPDPNNYPFEYHHYYRMMANAMEHLYFSISNLSEKEIDFIKNKKALEIIRML
jgi:hypothetical protein